MRNRFLLFLVVLLTVSCFAVPLQLSSEVGIHTDAWKTRMEGFTKETGIEVEIQQFPYANYLDQLMLGYTSGRVEIDVPYISMLWYPALSIANYIYPISDIPGYEKINESDIPGIRNAKLNGKTYIVPYMNELGGIIYRKDLFEDPTEKANFIAKYGYELQPPQTLEQYRDIAEFFNRPPDLYGVTLMGRRSIFLATHFMQRLWAKGGALLDLNMRPIFNSEAGIEALEEVKYMFQFANPAAMNYDFQEALNEFIGGRSAMAEVWTTGMFYVEDESRSSVVGKGGFVGFPRLEEKLGEKLPMLYISWGFSVSSAAQDKEAALDWLLYVTETQNEVEAAPTGNIPARFSALNSPLLAESFPWIGDFAAAMENCIPTPIVPLIPEGGSIVSGIIAPAVSEFLAGTKTAEQALNDAVKEVDRLMRDGGYY
ncbi:MAG: extracellular solute-binding protein [Mesotoga sp.]|uniref:ABC transporter substrate-binding protein n=1 Tax=Mesotoga sp. TaxID=2053577 RepID=UPI00356AC9AE